MRIGPFALLVSALCEACSSSANARNMKVYYVGFDVDTITGYHESDLPKVGCKAEIDENVFKNLLKHSTNAKYNSNDVKAMVQENDGGSYFIDYYGVVHHGREFYVINKKDFDSSLKYLVKC
jgi:hypothetical protein